MRGFVGMQREGKNHHGSQRLGCRAKALTCTTRLSCKNQPLHLLGRLEPCSPLPVYSSAPATSYPAPPPLALLYTECGRKIKEACTHFPPHPQAKETNAHACFHLYLLWGGCCRCMVLCLLALHVRSWSSKRLAIPTPGSQTQG